VKKVALLLLTFALVTTVTAWALVGGRTPAEQYTLAPVEYGRIAELINASGVVQPRETFTVGTDLNGQVVELTADYNQTVEEGDLLLRLDDRLARQRVDQAEAAVEQARVGVKQADAVLDAARLLRDNVEARNPMVRGKFELDAEQSKVRAAEVAVDAARAKLREAEESRRQADLARQLTEVRAPVLADEGQLSVPGERRSGTGVLDLQSPVPQRERRKFLVLDRQASLGQQVGPPHSGRLFTLTADLSRVRVHAQVAEADVNKVVRGQEATFTVSGGDGEPAFTARVEEVRLTPITAHGAVFYEVLLDAANRRNPDSGEWYLRPGQTATVDIVRRPREAAWKVPLAALNFQPEESEKTEAAKAKLARWKERKDAEAWKPVWVLGADHKPWPVFVKVGVAGQPDAAVQDAQFSEVLAWDPELTPTPRGDDPQSFPQVITAWQPPKKHGLFTTPKIKL